MKSTQLVSSSRHAGPEINDTMPRRRNASLLGRVLMLIGSVLAGIGTTVDSASAQQTVVQPPALIAYYFNDNRELIVVEAIQRPRQIKTRPNAPGWMELMMDASCSKSAHTDPDTGIEIKGKAATALYVLFQKDADPKLIATEDLTGISRMVRPPRAVDPGGSGICCCQLVPCGLGRKCCPCGTTC